VKQVDGVDFFGLDCGQVQVALQEAYYEGLVVLTEDAQDLLWEFVK
jgi:hypothetical protein